VPQQADPGTEVVLVSAGSRGSWVVPVWRVPAAAGEYRLVRVVAGVHPLVRVVAGVHPLARVVAGVHPLARAVAAVHPLAPGDEL